MPYGDCKNGKSAGSRLSVAFDRARLHEELESEKLSNIEVGDLLGELASAIRFRMKLGQNQGDWIEEPERMFTDGNIFATEEAVASNVKLQVTLSLDASTSMWVNKLMKHAGPTFMALDRMIRKALQDLPAGSIHYAPFIFHETAHKVPAAFLQNYAGKSLWASGEETGREIWPVHPSHEQYETAKAAGEIPADLKRGDSFLLSGNETRLAPLFRTIQEWEQKDGDPTAVRLDIIIIDGVTEQDGDTEAATAVQEERNGKLRTVFLNFLPLDQWINYTLPDRCAQFAVTAEDFEKNLRVILSEAVADLFA